MERKAQELSMLVKLIALAIGLVIGVYFAIKFGKPLLEGWLP